MRPGNFRSTNFGLPDNDSYRSYADLDRDYVVWNIVAVPEFSLQPKTWCYPVVGCVSYRGYFSRDKARIRPTGLRGDGYDVAFGGVAAYSTLGRFDDPVLNTMTHWGDDDLVAVMFHELAHQVLYIKDDTEFNESFATAVEEIGMERWLASRQQSDKLDAWQARRALRAEFTQLVGLLRSELAVLYSSACPPRRCDLKSSDCLSSSPTRRVRYMRTAAKTRRDGSIPNSTTRDWSRRRCTTGACRNFATCWMTATGICRAFTARRPGSRNRPERARSTVVGSRRSCASERWSPRREPGAHIYESH